MSLLRAPVWRGAPTDLDAYGRLLAADLDSRDERVDLLVGLSVGTQAAAAAAARTARVRRLLLSARRSARGSGRCRGCCRRGGPTMARTSPASSRDLAAVLRRHGVVPRLIAVDPRKSPHDIGSLARYGPALAKERPGGIPFEPLAPGTAVEGLRTIVGERGRPVA